MTVDPRDRFTGLAAMYQRHRPGYPPELLDWILDLFPPDRPRACADVGCGTGISTRLVADRGIDVTGVDPNEDMLSVARAQGGKAGGKARYVRGDAEQTGLPGASVDLVTAAQSFHWFDTTRALTEFLRILRPDGRCAVFWNVPVMTPFQTAYRDVIKRWCDTTHQALPRTRDATASIRADPRAAGLVEATFGTLQQFDAEGLLGRAHSSSYVPLGLGGDPARRAAFDAEMRRVFAEHQQGGVVNFPYECQALAWRFAP